MAGICRTGVGSTIGAGGGGGGNWSARTGPDVEKAADVRAGLNRG